MGWSFVAAVAFGIYGSVLHPVVGLIGFALPIMIFFIRKKEREAEDSRQKARNAQELASFQNRLRERLNEKSDDVRKTFRVTAKTSPMGLRDYRRFDLEIIRFLETGLTESDLQVCQRNGTSVRKVYDQSIRGDLQISMEGDQTNQSGSVFSFNGGSPVDFERHCAQLFRSCGWHVVETPASGDHGVDLIVSRNGDSIAVQCKLYSQPVGNSAVQEVVAGRVHYGANAAVVVAANGYTSGAEVLARSNAVRLIHPDDIKSQYGFSAIASTKSKPGSHLDWPPKKRTSN